MALVHDSIGDFLLFPRDPTHFEMPSEEDFHSLHFGANARSEYQPPYSAGSSYDNYPAASVYPPAAPLYYTTPRYEISGGKAYGMSEPQRYTPAGSPSPSVSQAFDQPPSTLSSASGASVQSTASSAVGSPYSHATNTLPGHDQWTESRHGLGIAPEIVHNDGFAQETMFPLGSMDNDLVFDESKLQGNFVGESGTLSSPSFPHVQASPSISSRPVLRSSTTSSSLIPNATPADSSLVPKATPADTSPNGRDVTIDTILEEVNSRMSSPRRTVSPNTAQPAHPAPGSFRGVYDATSPLGHTGGFKSPTTPASAMSPYHPGASIPPGPYQRDHLNQSSIIGADTRVRRGSNSPTERFSHSRSAQPRVQDHFPIVRSQSPFFSQSSGRFVPPLQSSCWFSLLSPFVFYPVENEIFFHL